MLLSGPNDQALLDAMTSALSPTNNAGFSAWTDQLKHESILGRRLPLLNDQFGQAYSPRTQLNAVLNRLGPTYPTLTALQNALEGAAGLADGVLVTAARDLPDNLELDVQFRRTATQFVPLDGYYGVDLAVSGGLNMATTLDFVVTLGAYWAPNTSSAVFYIRSDNAQFGISSNVGSVSLSGTGALGFVDLSISGPAASLTPAWELELMDPTAQGGANRVTLTELFTNPILSVVSPSISSAAPATFVLNVSSPIVPISTPLSFTWPSITSTHLVDSNIATDPGLAQLNNYQTIAADTYAFGLNAMAQLLGSGAANLPALNAPLPLVNRSFTEALDLTALLNNALTKYTDVTLVNSQPMRKFNTANQLLNVLRAIPGVGAANASVSATGGDIRYTLTLPHNVTRNYPIHLGISSALDLNLTGNVNLALNTVTTLTFGVSAATGEFFVVETGTPAFTAAATVTANVNANTRLGFLDVSITNGTLSLTGNASLTLNDPATDSPPSPGRITSDELEAGNLAALVHGTAGGSASANLPLSTSLFPQSGTLSVNWADITNASAFTLNTAAVTQFVGFNNIVPDVARSGLAAVPAMLKGLSGGEFLGLDLQFLGASLGKVFELGTQFENHINLLSNFTTAQGLRTALQNRFGAGAVQMQVTGNALEFVIQQTQNLVNRSVAWNLGDSVSGLGFQSSGNVLVNGSFSTSLRFGISFDEGLSPQDRFYIIAGPQSSASAAFKIQATNLSATASLGFLTVGVSNGTATLAGRTGGALDANKNTTIALSLVDPSGADGRITLGDLLGNPLSALGTPAVDGAASVILPITGLPAPGAQPRITLAWTDITNPSTISVNHQDLGDLNPANFFNSLTTANGLQSLIGLIGQWANIDLLNTKIPLVDIPLKDIFNFITKGTQFFQDIRNADISDAAKFDQAVNAAVAKANAEAAAESGGMESAGNPVTLTPIEVNIPGGRFRYLVELNYNFAEPGKPFNFGSSLFSLNATLQPIINFHAFIEFGINKDDGFFLVDRGPEPEIKLTAGLNAAFNKIGGDFGPLTYGVSNGFANLTFNLGLNLTDPNNSGGPITPAEMTGNFTSVFDPSFLPSSGGHLHLPMGLRLGSGGPGVTTVFDAYWSPSDPTTFRFGPGMSTNPTDGFGPVNYELGEFVDRIVGEVLRNIRDFNPIPQEILDILVYKLPLIEKTPLQILGDFTDNEAVKLLIEIIQVINAIPGGGAEAGGDKINLSDYFDGEANEGSSGSPQGGNFAPFTGFINMLKNDYDIHLPVLEDPAGSIISVLLGKDVTFIEWKPKRFEVSVSVTSPKITIPVFSLGVVDAAVTAQIGGEVGFFANVHIGLTSRGLTGNAIGGQKNLLDGFFIGNEEDFQVGVFGKVFFNLGGTARVFGIPIVEVYGQLGLELQVGLHVADVKYDAQNFPIERVGRGQPGGDGKVHLDELAWLVGNYGIFCTLTLGGGLFLTGGIGFKALCTPAFLGAEICLVDIFIDAPSAPLFYFDLPCGPRPPSDLAYISGNSLIMHTDSRTGDWNVDVNIVRDREMNPAKVRIQRYNSTTIEYEEFTIEELQAAGVNTLVVEGTAGNDRIRIDPLLTSVLNIQYITVNARAGNDQVEFGQIDPATSHLLRTSIYGHGGNDTLQGTFADDYIDGGDGNDRILAGAGNDTLLGGAGNDTISAGDGNATIWGGDGDDLIDNTAGNVTVYGEGGNDTINTADGNDCIFGGDGNDRIYTSGGNNTIYGGAGNDVIQAAGDGHNLIFGEDGNDTIAAGNGNDTINAGAGNDSVMANHGDNIIWGEDGNDTILAGDGNDWIDGGLGNDSIHAGHGDNKVYGSLGNDRITTGRGQDIIFGGPGNDTISAGAGDDFIDAGAGNDVVDGGSGTDLLSQNLDTNQVLTNTTVTGFGTTTFTNIERVSLAGGVNDNTFDISGWTGMPVTIDGEGGTNTVISTNDADFIVTDTSLWRSDGASFYLLRIQRIQLTGGAGDNSFDVTRWTNAGSINGGVGGLDRVVAENNANFTLTDVSLARTGFGTLALSNINRATLTGGLANNLIDASGFSGNASLFGLAGNDTLIGGSGHDYLDGGPGNDSIVGNAGDDILIGGGGANDTLEGGSGDDTIHGSDDGADLILAGPGDDLVFGYGGNDTIFGGPGNDTLMGGDGYDWISGDAGSDLIVGGAGHDVLYGHNNSGVGDDNAVDYIYGDFATGGNEPGSGNDRIYGQGGNDLLYGEGGFDFIDGGDTGDIVNFGPGGGTSSIGAFPTPPTTPNPPVTPFVYTPVPPTLPTGPAGLGPWAEFSASASGGGVSNSPGTAADPAIAAGTNVQYIAWVDDRTGNYEIYVARQSAGAWQELAGSAHEGGVSVTSTASRQPSITLDGLGNPLVAWVETTLLGQEVRAARFDAAANGGQGGWVSLGVVGSALSIGSPKILNTSAGPVVVWINGQGGTSNVYVRRWSGSAWQELGSGSAGGSGVSGATSVADLAVATNGTNVSVAWTQVVGGVPRIYLKQYNGTNWAEVNGSASGNGLSGVEGSAAQAAIAYHGGVLYAAWQKTVDGVANIAAARASGGAWVGVSIDTPASAGNQITRGVAARPVLAASAAGLYLLWTEDRLPLQSAMDTAIYANRLVGTAFRQQLPGDASHHGIHRTSTQVAGLAAAVDSAGRPFVAWGDVSSGSPEIYFRGHSHAIGNVYYVNNALTADDTFTTAAGAAGNNGQSPAAPMPSVQAVLDAYTLGAGDVIVVDSGSHGGFNIGAGDSGVSILGHTGVPSTFGAVSITAANVALHVLNLNGALSATGATALNFASGSASSITLSGGSGALIQRNTIGAITLTGAAASPTVEHNRITGGLAINAGSASSVLVRDNRIGGPTGIALSAAASGTIRGNDVSATGTGIAISAAFTGAIEHNRIHGGSVGVNYAARAPLNANRIYGNATGVIASVNSLTDGLGFVGDAAPNLIYANTTGVNLTGRMQKQQIFRNATGVVGSGILGGLDLANANVIEFNTTGVNFNGTVQFTKIGRNATGIVAKDGQLIAHNEIYRNSGAGISTQGAKDVRIIHNTIYGTAGRGISVSGGSTEVQVMNNIIWAAGGHGLYVEAGSRGGFFSDYNTLHATGGEQIVHWLADFNDILDWQQDVHLFDLHSFGRSAVNPNWAEPRFRDLHGNDYRVFDLVSPMRFSSPTVGAAHRAMDLALPASSVSLLANPSFESGVASWTVSSGGTTKSASPTPFDGAAYFNAAAAAAGFAQQTVNLASAGHANAQIDSGTLVAIFGGRIRSAAEPTVDQGRLVLTFLDGSGSAIGSPVTLHASNATDRWELVGERAAIPAGTRSICYRFEASRLSGTTNDSHLDGAFLYVQSYSANPDQGAYGNTAAETTQRQSAHIRLLWPDLYTNWVASRPLDIRWATYANAGASTVRIDLLQDTPGGPQLLLNLTPSTPDTGIFTWILQNSGIQPGTHGLRIQVSLVSDNIAIDRSSETFSIPETGNNYYVDDASNGGDQYTPSAVGSNRHTGKLPTAPLPLLTTVLRTYPGIGPADTIHIDAGSYNHFAPVRISGTPGLGSAEGVTITGPTTGGTAAIAPLGFASPAVFDINDGDFVNLRRLTISGGEYGVLVRNGSTDFVGSHLVVTGASVDGIRIEADSPNAKLDHITATANARDGIAIAGPFGLIESSTAHGNTRNGFLFANAGAGVLRSSIAYNNRNGLSVTNSTTGTTTTIGDADLALARGNRFYDNVEFGVWANGSILIAGNVVYGQGLPPAPGFTGGVGINLIGPAQATRNVIHNNYDGVRATGNIISFNRIYSNANFGIRNDGSSTIDGNVIYSNAVGIQSNTPTNSSDGPFIRNNVVYANASGGVRLSGGRNAQIHNNTIYEPAADALRIEPLGGSGGVNISVRNNILWTGAGYAIAVSPLSEAGFSSDYNLLYATGAGQIGLWAGVPRPTLREWRFAGFTDGNSISKDPLFVDANGADNILGGAGGFDDDFHLRSTAGSFHGGSLAPILSGVSGLPVFPVATLTADAQLSPGINRGDPAFSYANEPAPNGAFIDMGAYGNTPQASLSPASYVLMIRPDGGEIALAEATFNIVWRSQNTAGTVNIALFNGGSFVANIASNAPNSGEYLWTVPNSIAPGSNYFIRVTRTDDAGATDINDAPMTIFGPNHVFYVNDSTVQAGDWTTAPGSNANTGLTPADPMASIRAVIETYNLSSADTIRVDAGTYTLSTNIVITATDAGVKIQGYHDPAFPARSAILNRNNTAAGSYVFQLINADNVILDRLTITGAEVGVYAANGSDSDNITISNSVIHGNVTAGIYLWETNDNATLTGNTIHGQTGVGADGIVLRSVFATITNNTIRDNPDAGIAIDGDGKNTLISGNRVHNNNNVGIAGSNLVVTGNTVYANRSIGVQVANSTVTGNVIHSIVASAGGLGIGLQLAGGTASGNILHGNSTGVRAFSAGVVSNSRIYNNAVMGLDLGADMVARENVIYSNGIGVQATKAANTVGEGPFLHNNLIYANATIGIYVIGGRNAVIGNNTVYQPTGDAFRMVPSAGSVNVQVRSNIFIAASGYVMWVDPASQTGLISNHNLLRATGPARTGYWGGADRVTLNDWRLASVNDADSINADPLFVNITGADGILGYGGPASDGRDDDFHLRSLFGSFHGGSFAPVLDAVTGMPVYLVATLTLDGAQSPAIDRGAPGDSFDNEPAPNGGFVNLGAYGNTAQASKSPQQYMLVTRPDGGEAWATKQTFSIRWRNEIIGTGTVTIELMRLGPLGELTVEALIAPDAPNSGVYTWLIPQAIPAASDYLIRITHNATAQSDLSDSTFSIAVATPIFYVNDATVEPGDWTTAPGNDNNDGLTPATPKATIAALLAAYDFEPGDVIRVDAGTYTLANNILLQPEDSGVRIAGYADPLFPGRKAVLDRNDTNNGVIFQLAGGDDIVIENFVLTNALYGVTSTAGQASDNITLLNNEFHGMSRLFSGYAVYIIGNANGLSLIGNTIRNNDQGVHIQTVSNLTVSGNSFQNNRARALSASSINGGLLDGNHFFGNTIGVGVNAVEASSSSNTPASAVTISNNLLHDNGTTALLISNNVLAIGNTVHSHAGASSVGINVAGGEARSNTVYGNATGINVASSGLAVGNRVFGNRVAGIYVGYSGVLRGNTVYSNPTGILGDAAPNAAARGPYLYNNLVYANANNGIHIRGGSDAEIFNNTVFQPTGDGIRLDGAGSLGSVNIQLRNNIVVVHAGYALRISDNSAPRFSSDYNNLHATGSGMIGNWAGRDFPTREAWTWSLQLDTRGQSTDPLFVSPAGADGILGFVDGVDYGADDNFALSPASPSIDAGDPAFYFLTEPGPNGGRINLGHHGNTPHATPSPAQFVQVLSPNGLEKLEAGTQYPITWHSSGLRTSYPVATINAAGPASGGWSANAFIRSFSTGTATGTIDRGGIANPAPEAVYQTYAIAPAGTGYNLTYTLPVPDGTYDLRLHFVEPGQFTPVGARRMDISVNGAVMAANYDIRAVAGAHNKATVLSFTATASGGGGLTINLATLGTNVYPAILSGIELTQPNAAGLPSPSANIELSTDNGANWTIIAAAQPMDIHGRGSFLWTAGPQTTGNTALIRVTANTPGSPQDQSDAPFRIANGGIDYYINDNSTAGDLLTTAVGNDANSGKSPDQPMASLDALILTYALGPGDVIHADAGVYSLVRNIRIGTEDSGVRIQGPGGSAVALFNRNNTAWDGAAIFELAGASDVIIDSLTLTNAYYAVRAPSSADSDRVTISNSDIHDNYHGIHIGSSNDDWVISGNQIHHNTIGGNFSNGIYTLNVRSTITGNRIYSNFNRGIYFEGSGQGTLVAGNEIYLNRTGIQGAHATISGNRVYLNSVSGIAVSGSLQAPALVEGNTVHSHIGTTVAAIGIDAINAEVRSNTVYNNTIGINANGGFINRNKVYSNTAAGIAALGTAPAIWQNLIYANGNIAIRLTNASSATIYGNTVYHTVGEAVRLQGSANATIRNNIIWVEAGHGLYFADTASQAGARSDRNLLHRGNSPQAHLGFWAGASRTLLADWQAASVLDADSISADPLFMDIDGGDNVLGYNAATQYDGGFDDNFKLRAGSPAIDRADSFFGTRTDIEYQPRHDDPATPNAGTTDYQPADQGSSLFAATGTAANYRSNSTWFTYNAMPFAFPFFDATYTTVYVSTEGFLQFGVTTGAGDGNNSTAGLIAARRIAPLWDNLRTSGTGNDVFIDTATAGQITFRWNATSEADSSPVNFAATLFSDGRIRFDYGAGNANLTPTVGISMGDGHHYFILPYSGAASLANANSILFNRVAGFVDIGAYELVGSSADTVGPTITATSPASIHANGSVGILSQITLSLSEAVVAVDALSPLSYELRAAGPNGLFDDADDFLYAVRPSYTAGATSVLLDIPGGPLPLGNYRLTVFGGPGRGIHDEPGNFLDGDANGVPGGNYVRTFAVNSGLVLTALPGNNTFTLRLNPAGTALQVWHNVPTSGPASSTIPLGTANPIIVIGGSGDDTLILDLSNGNFIPAGGISFDGKAQATGDSLHIIGNGANALVYTPSATLAGAGVVMVDGSPVHFTGLEPVTISAAASVTLVTPNASDSITIDAPEPGTNRVFGTSGGVAFEPLVITGVPELILDLAANDGGAGNDAVTIGPAGLIATGLNVLRVNAGTGLNTLSVNGGPATIDATLGLGGIHLTLNTAGNAQVVLPGTQRFAAINVGGNSRLALPASGANALITSALAISTGGQLDLADNAMIIHATPVTRAGVLAAVTGQIASARNSMAGRWLGSGLTSSAAAANPLTGLAAILNDEGGNPVRASLNGQPADINSILVRHTWDGDIDLSGTIDGDDYFLMDRGFLMQGTGYGRGDVNYDGRTDAADYFLLDRIHLLLSTGLTPLASPTAIPPLSPWRTGTPIASPQPSAPDNPDILLRLGSADAVLA